MDYLVLPFALSPASWMGISVNESPLYVRNELINSLSRKKNIVYKSI